MMAFPAHALKAADPDKWQFEGAVYLWGADIDVSPVSGDDTRITFNELINNLNLAFMGMFGLRKGEWSAFADVIYLDVGDSETSTLGDTGIPTKVQVDINAWVITMAGGYTAMQTDKFRLDVIAGGRYFWLKLPTKIKIGNGKKQKAESPSGHVWDGIVGVKGVYDLSDKWYLSYYADLGTGQSDFTWQAAGGVNYRFKKVDLAVGYRYLDWNVGGNAIDELTIKGPYGGVRFAF